METRRREFLRQISGVTALGSLLGRDTRAGSSQDVSSAETQTISYLESLRAQFPVLAERVSGTHSCSANFRVTGTRFLVETARSF